MKWHLLLSCKWCSFKKWLIDSCINFPEDRTRMDSRWAGGKWCRKIKGILNSSLEELVLFVNCIKCWKCLFMDKEWCRKISFDGTSPSKFLKKGSTFFWILVKAQNKMDPFNFLFFTKVKMAPLLSYLIISTQNLHFHQSSNVPTREGIQYSSNEKLNYNVDTYMKDLIYKTWRQCYSNFYLDFVFFW